MNKVITGVVAGVIVFIWGMFSWMALPLHKQSFDDFKAQAIVSKAILAGAPTSGMYVHPNWDTPPAEASKMPKILTVVSHEEKNMMLCMLKGLLIQVFAGLLITCLVSTAKLDNFKSKFIMVLKVAAFAGVVGVLPNLVWWSFTPHYTVLGFLDIMIGWSLAGVLIAKRV